MKVAVLGAAGWVGRAVLSNLEGKHEICAFDYGPKAWDHASKVDGEWSDGEVVHGDISDFSTVEKVRCKKLLGNVFYPIAPMESIVKGYFGSMSDP